MITKLTASQREPRSNGDYSGQNFFVEISCLAPHELHHAAVISTKSELFNASLSAHSVGDLQQRLSRIDQYVLGVRVHEDPMNCSLVGLLVCHAEEEDFIAETFVLDDCNSGCGIEREMVRVVGQMALSSGCGAVVLKLASSDRNSHVRQFFASLGAGIEALPTGQMEVVLASIAVEEILFRSAPVNAPDKLPGPTRLSPPTISFN